MKKIYPFLFLMCLLNINTFAQTDEAYKEALFEMFELSGSEETYAVAVNQMMTMFEQQFQGEQKELWQDIQKEFTEKAMDDFKTLLIPVYEKHLTLDDIRKLNEFYRTPVGSKLAEKTPLITSEAMIVGQQWGTQVATELIEKMNEERK